MICHYERPSHFHKFIKEEEEKSWDFLENNYLPTYRTLFIPY